MDEHTLVRLFDPFFTTKFTGRGLGMSAILGIVRGHKGAIVVSSDVSRGSTIRVLFPAWRAVHHGAAADEHATPASVPARQGQHGRILVVDDEDLVRTVTRRMLERDGWEVVEASNGPDAFEIYSRDPDRFDCVVLDLSMPRMDGRAVFRDMRAIRPDVIVVLTSGFAYDHAADETGARADRPAGFIQKPYASQALRDELTRVLRRGPPPE
jgi:CheY-like chemotaxis protein